MKARGLIPASILFSESAELLTEALPLGSTRNPVDL
jgi:hypothetical protein